MGDFMLRRAWECWRGLSGGFEGEVLLEERGAKDCRDPFFLVPSETSQGLMPACDRRDGNDERHRRKINFLREITLGITLYKAPKFSNRKFWP